MITVRNIYKQENYTIEPYGIRNLQVIILERHASKFKGKIIITETMLVEYIEDLLKEL